MRALGLIYEYQPHIITPSIIGIQEKSLRVATDLFYYIEDFFCKSPQTTFHIKNIPSGMTEIRVLNERCTCIIN